METAKKNTKSENGGHRAAGILKSVQALDKDHTPFDKLFKKIKSTYESMTDQEKEWLFRAFIEQMEVRKDEITPLVSALQECKHNDPKWPSLLADLRNHSFSPRLKIFRKISRFPGGLKFLLDFRGDLLSVRRHSILDLSPLDSDITFLFEIWFQEGFLYLEEITLDSAYKQIELIKNNDLVHPMSSIEEMGQRLGRDRRCFALYHRLLPFEPIIFIEVALTEGLVKEVREIMNSKERGEGRSDTAIFYSINNTQNGLAGLGLGKILIGKVVEYLKKENEKIKNFATLSPVPGFWIRYLEPLLKGKDDGLSLKQGDIISLFSKKAAAKILERTGKGMHSSDQFNEALLSILSNESWAEDDGLKKDLRNPLVKIAYHYIAREKNLSGKPLNPVAGFHLGNGAKISEKNINFLANPSKRGLQESCGIMVNYIYSSSWISQLGRSFRRFDMMEVKGLFTRRP